MQLNVISTADRVLHFPLVAEEPGDWDLRCAGDALLSVDAQALDKLCSAIQHHSIQVVCNRVFALCVVIAF